MRDDLPEATKGGEVVPLSPQSGMPTGPLSPRRGLGRGLDALIPGGSPGVVEIEVERIRPNPRQPRHTVAEAQLAELAESIKAHGVIQPIVVARAPDGAYVLIAGERRWSAAKLAGLARVPAVVKEATPQQMLELALVENIQRADLNPLEEAAAYQQLIDDFGLTQESLAQRVGRGRATVANTLRLLALPEPAKRALAQGTISEGHARALLGAPDAAELVGYLEEVVERQLTVRETEDLVRRGRAPERAERKRRLADPEIRGLEDLFREALATKVEIVRSGAGGRLIIHFFSDEQLQSIYDALNKD